MSQFGGAVADAYLRVFECNAPMFAAVLAAVRADVPAAAPGRAGDGLRLLDVASGPGEPATTLARALPGAAVACTDVAPDMVAKARVRAAGLPNVTFAVVDAADLSAHADASVDVLTCCYGVMFVPDTARALREFRRVLAPDGVAYVAVWRALALMPILRAVMAEVTGAAPPPPAINPLRYAAEGAVEALCAEAGLQLQASQAVSYDFDLGADVEDAFRTGSVPIAATLAELEAAGQADVRARARDAWVRRVEAAGMRTPDGRFVMSGSEAKLLTLRA
jgi:SAM-dependent methyltransferase